MAFLGMSRYGEVGQPAGVRGQPAEDHSPSNIPEAIRCRISVSRHRPHSEIAIPLKRKAIGK